MKWKLKKKPLQAIEILFDRFIEAYNNKTPSILARTEMVYVDGKKVILEKTEKNYVAIAIYDHSTVTMGLAKEQPSSKSIVIAYPEKYNLMEVINTS